MIHRYRAYGFDLQSRSEIPGLTPQPASCDSAALPIEVTVGACPEWACEALRMPVTLRYSGNKRFNNLPRFRVEQLGAEEFFRLCYADGTQVVADGQTKRIWGGCPPPLTPEDLSTYLLGPVMGFVLRRRGILALHASSFCVDGCAFALCGGARIGKSTTAAALAMRGISILCEDITAVREREGKFQVAPGYPRVNLWPDSVAQLFGSSAKLPKITPNWEKQFLDLEGNTAKFETQDRPVAGIYIMEPRSEAPETPRIEEISTQRATIRLVQNTYMNYLLDREQRAREFDAIARLVSGVSVKLLKPSKHAARINDMCEMLETDARSTCLRESR